MNKKYVVTVNNIDYELEKNTNGKFKIPKSLREVTNSGLNIDAGRVPIDKTTTQESGFIRRGRTDEEVFMGNDKNRPKGIYKESSGRYPAQLFLDGAIAYTREEIDLDNKDFLEFIGIDSDVIKFMDKEKALDYICQHLDKFDVSKLLDEQSFISKPDSRQGKPTGNRLDNTFRKWNSKECDLYGDSGGCSRILHNASFVLSELYQHIYYSKASQFERDAGCEYMEEKQYSHDGRKKHIENPYQRQDSKAKNNHPTLKSLKLLYNIITLFKTVDIEKAKICIPFSGVSSEEIGWLAHGVLEENITAIEINPEYIQIGKARKKYWKKYNYFFKEEKKVFDRVKNRLKNDLKEQIVPKRKIF